MGLEAAYNGGSTWTASSLPSSEIAPLVLPLPLSSLSPCPPSPLVLPLPLSPCPPVPLSLSPVPLSPCPPVPCPPVPCPLSPVPSTDTEGLYTVAQQRILSRFNREFTWALKVKMMGKKAAEAAKVVIEELGLQGEMSAEEFLKERENLLREEFPHCKLLPGMEGG
ncbi:unnamed protein product [Closterium sp. NIES-53]